jgi:hypothetical protein
MSLANPFDLFLKMLQEKIDNSTFKKEVNETFEDVSNTYGNR